MSSFLQIMDLPMRRLLASSALLGIIGIASAEPGVNPADNAWVLFSAALVLLMIPGVGLFYGGMVRKKNAISTMIFSFAIMGTISLQWILLGYTLAFGPDVGGLIGGLDHLGLRGVGMEAMEGQSIPALTFMIFQAMFAVITVSLITGSYVERIKFSSFLVFSLAWATLVYDPIAHWVWGGGFLSEMGVLDFAGGIVVHISAGVSALAIAMVIGARRGFGRDPMEPHNIPTTVLGASLLWFGWFGFNAGSALAADGLAANAFVVTNTSAAAGALAWLFASWVRGKPSALGMVSGGIAGLVAITPAAGFVDPLSSLVIGAVAGVLCYRALLFRVGRGLDESLDAWAVHGVGGLWGAIATGIFAVEAVGGHSGLLQGNVDQLIAQVIGAVAAVAYAFVVTYALARAVDATMGLRVSENEEYVGLDISQHGEKAYA